MSRSIRQIAPSLLSLLTLSVLFIGSPLAAQEKETFTDERFDELQAAGEVILVDVWASWCPTCAQQQDVLAAFQAEHPDVQFHILEVDFDDRKDLVTRFEAPRQSTLIIYRGEERLWFSVAETRRDRIFDQLLAASDG